MYFKRRLLLAVFLALLFVYFLYVTNNLRNLHLLEEDSFVHMGWMSGVKKSFIKNSMMAIAVVACGDRSQETLMMLKSALLLTKGPLQFYIFTDEDLIQLFTQKLGDWQVLSNKTFQFDVRPVRFPNGQFQSEWQKLFKPCAAERLFLPDLLNSTDAVLYVDTDTLFLGPVEQVWSHFKAMNSSQFAALAPEHEDPMTGWYNRFARHPFYKPLGVNTGVMLMNLTRMRHFQWQQNIIPIYKKYKLKIPWGDQDIINILFHYHPDKLYIYSCNYNYRSDHCMYTSVCKAAEKEGVIVLHGSRGIFHSDKHPPFQSVYKAMEEWGMDLYKDFFLPLQLYLNASTDSNCGKRCLVKAGCELLPNQTECNQIIS